MPLPSSLVGKRSKPITHTVDARWLMAYAAGIADTNSAYHDTTQSIAAHPVFPVALEWPAILDCREEGNGVLTIEEAARGVHAAHDLHLRSPIVANSEVTTVAEIVGVMPSRAGAVQTLRILTNDASGALLSETWQTSIFRGVDVDGPGKLSEPPPKLAVAAHATTEAMATRSVDPLAAHVYTECARIWNPIHTDRAYAHAAGLADIILHGTATLAYAVTEIVERFAQGDPTRVKRLGGQFRAAVELPSTIGVHMRASEDGCVAFEVVNGDGDDAIRAGFVELTPTGEST